MKLDSFKTMFGSIKTAAIEHSPEILVGLGTAGLIISGITGILVTPKALKHIEEKKKEEEVDVLPKLEVAKAVWKDYIPSAIGAGISTGCIIMGTTEGSKRNAALATACGLAEEAFNDYKNHVIETLGSEKEAEIEEHVAQDKVKRNPPVANEIILTETDGTLCYEPISGRWFRSNPDRIRKAETEINHILSTDISGIASLNDFYDALGLDNLKIGDLYGWNMEKGFLKISFSSMLTTEDRPCLVIKYDPEPTMYYAN